jgi:hypothetical protein
MALVGSQRNQTQIKCLRFAIIIEASNSLVRAMYQTTSRVH